MGTHPTAKRTALAIAIAGALGATAAQAAEPYQKPDDSFVSISGTVTSPTADDFVLDYGSGTILVEMDDWDSYGDAYGLMDGDRVTVFGRIDDDFFEVAKVEAGSVYVENLNTYFYANAADEETGAWNPQYWTAPSPVVVSAMTLRGDIVDVDAEEREFTVAYNPLDDNGYQQLDEGDFVSVSGMMDYEFMDGRVFVADAVTTLVDEQNS